MNWLYRFMYGRYGADQLTFALIILYLILSLTLTLIPVPLIWLLAYIPMVFCFYRMLSRNIAKRQAENWAFLRVWNPVKNWLNPQIKILRPTRNINISNAPIASRS